MATYFLQIDGMLNSNVCYTLIGMATKCDVIMTSLILKISDFKKVQ